MNYDACIPTSTRDYTPDFGSDTWLFVSTWAEAELIKARKTNDLLKTGPEKTIEVRSRIKILKEILNMRRATSAKNTPAMIAGEGSNYAR